MVIQVARFNQLKKLRSIVANTRLLSTQTENAGPIVFQRLTGVDRGIAVYGLNSPKDRNALGFDLLDAMREVNQLIREDTKLSVVILHSLVPGIFCAGANLKERFKMSDEEVCKFVRGLRETFIEIEDLPMPTIAAVEGVAVGGGLELALACDIRVAAETAKLGLVETGRGLIPGAGGTQRLPRAVNLNIAKELIFTSRIVSGSEAKELGKYLPICLLIWRDDLDKFTKEWWEIAKDGGQWKIKGETFAQQWDEIGIVNHVVPQNNTKNAALEKALELAREITPNAPIALRCAKQAVNQGIQLSIKDGYEVEQRFYEVNVPTKDRQEGMISFLEKRKPIYEGH